MSLKYKLDTLDGLDEALKPLYAKEGDKYVLQVEDSGAKSALQKERERADAAEKALKEREKVEADAKAAADRAEQEKRGEYDKLIAAKEAELKKTQEALATKDGFIKRSAIERTALEAITASGGIPKALLPHLQDQLEAVADGDTYKVLVKGDPGKSVQDLVSGMKADKQWAWGFNGSGASGGGAPTGGAAAGGAAKKPWKDMTLREQTELFKSDPTQAKSLQSQGA